MKRYIFIILVMFSSFFLVAQIKLHPENPHYFSYNGKPTILIASTEHYGAVINSDFDYKKYLDKLSDAGLNLTRVFMGDYCEAPHDFCIENNTLSPAKGKLITPWARSSEKGYYNGGNKFNLSRWNPAYFKRLHDFMQYASDKGIVVEAVLFFSGYTRASSPLHTLNNINSTSDVAANKYMTLDNGNLIAFQEAYCRKIVRELNVYDNLIVNVANEPWFGNQQNKGFSSPPSDEVKVWIRTVSEWVADEEHKLPKKHLVSVDYTNEGNIITHEELKKYFLNIQVFNSHYDRNADFIKLNYNLNIPITFNETGLMPLATPEYRIQGWKYIFSGGSMYNNLDFTFQVGYEDGLGNGKFSCEWYSGNSDPETKYQLAALLKFMNGVDFIKMKPDDSFIELRYGDYEVFAMANENYEYIVYFIGRAKARIKLYIPPGDWEFTWINPSDLSVLKKELMTGSNRGTLNISGPDFQEDIVLKVKRIKK